MHQICRLVADGAEVDGVATPLQQEQLIKGFKDLDRRLVDGHHDGAPAGANLAHSSDDCSSSLGVQAAGWLVLMGERSMASGFSSWHVSARRL